MELKQCEQHMFNDSAFFTFGVSPSPRVKVRVANGQLEDTGGEGMGQNGISERGWSVGGPSLTPCVRCMSVGVRGMSIGPSRWRRPHALLSALATPGEEMMIAHHSSGAWATS